MREAKHLWLLALAAAGLLAAAGSSDAQTRLFARGAFEMPREALWNKKRVPPGSYQFAVRNLSTFQWVVEVRGEDFFETFVSTKDFVQGGKGLANRLILHLDPDKDGAPEEDAAPAEVASMEIPGPNYRLSFHCRHKKKKGADAPQQIEVLYRLSQ